MNNSINLFQMKSDIKSYNNKNYFTYNGHYNINFENKYFLEIIEKFYGMSFAKMEQYVEQEQFKRDNACLWFDNEINNDLLKNTRKLETYLNKDDKILQLIVHNYDLKRLFPDVAKATSLHFGKNWYYEYFDIVVCLNHLMVYFTFYRSTGGSFTRSSWDNNYVCGVDEKPITPLVLKEINKQFTQQSKELAVVEYHELKKQQELREIEAFRLKQIYGS